MITIDFVTYIHNTGLMNGLSRLREYMFHYLMYICINDFKLWHGSPASEDQRRLSGSLPPSTNAVLPTIPATAWW